jgi:hypothetical protein
MWRAAERTTSAGVCLPGPRSDWTRCAAQASRCAALHGEAAGADLPRPPRAGGRGARGRAASARRWRGRQRRAAAAAHGARDASTVGLGGPSAAGDRALRGGPVARERGTHRGHAAAAVRAAAALCGAPAAPDAPERREHRAPRPGFRPRRLRRHHRPGLPPPPSAVPPPAAARRRGGRGAEGAARGQRAEPDARDVAAAEEFARLQACPLPPPSLPFPIRVPLPYPSSTRVASFRTPPGLPAARCPRARARACGAAERPRRAGGDSQRAPDPRARAPLAVACAMGRGPPPHPPLEPFTPRPRAPPAPRPRPARAPRALPRAAHAAGRAVRSTARTRSWRSAAPRTRRRRRRRPPPRPPRAPRGSRSRLRSPGTPLEPLLFRSGRLLLVPRRRGATRARRRRRQQGRAAGRGRCRWRERPLAGGLRWS